MSATARRAEQGDIACLLAPSASSTRLSALLLRARFIDRGTLLEGTLEYNR